MLKDLNILTFVFINYIPVIIDTTAFSFVICLLFSVLVDEVRNYGTKLPLA